MKMMRAVSGTLLALALITQGLDAADLPVSPDEPNSHESYISLVHGAQSNLIDEVLAAYDRYLRMHPDDLRVAVQRCRFLGLVEYDEYEDYNPRDEQYQDCLQALIAREPDHPDVLELRLTQLWGREAEDFYETSILPRADRFSAKSLARVHEHLCNTLRWVEDPGPAPGEHAREAMALDPSLNLHDVVAEISWQKHKLLEAVTEDAWQFPFRKGAIEATRKYLENSEPGWEWQRSIALLVEMEAYDEARAAMVELQAADPEMVDPLQRANVLAGAGDVSGARTAFREAASSGTAWNEGEIRKEHFRFELKHGDAESAAAAYHALRDLGFSQDPILVRRIELARAFPGAAWSGRDILGALLIVGILVGLAVLPALLILPIHYFSLLRMRRSGRRRPRPALWGLRHVWILCGGGFLAAFVSTYLFYPQAFDWMLIEAETDLVIPDRALIQDGWFTAVVFAVLLVLVVQKRRFRVLWRNRWSARKTVGQLILWLILGGIVGSLVRIGNADIATTTFTDQWMLAFGRTYGALPLLIMIAGLVPFLEEFVFRGVLLTGFRRHLPFWVANGLQASAFSLVHENWDLFLYYVFFGFVAGEMRRRSGGLIVPVLYHAGNNFVFWLGFLAQLL